ncbi:MAG: DUF6599 family protein [Terracidiphilus sp.]
MKRASLLAGLLLAAAAAGAQPYLDCHLVPGWEPSGTVRSYTADNLYDYRDGAAEGYLIYGFARMQGIDCKSGAVTLSIDVSEMGDADLAWGMFAANRDPREPIAPIGMGGQLLPQSLLFARGRYFVEIVETDGNPAGDQTAALKAFAAKMAALLDGRQTPPEALQWFPPARQTSVRLVPESVLGLRVLKRGFVARYEQGQAFVVVEESPQSAAEVMKSLAARYPGAEPAKLGDEAFQGKVPYLDGICIFRKGRIVAGAANLAGPEQAAALAAQLAQRLPSRP